MTRARQESSSVLLFESDEPLAHVIRRALGGGAVLIANGVNKALRALERTSHVSVIVSNYRLKDGTARKRFDVASKRWPGVRRVLYADTPRPATVSARMAVQLADAVADDFSELRTIVVAQ